MSSSADDAKPAPRATSRRRRLMLGAVIVAVIALGAVGAVVVQHRENVANQGLAGVFDEEERTYVAGSANQTAVIQQNIVQQTNFGRAARVAWGVSDADIAAGADFFVYVIKQAQYQTQMGQTPAEVYGTTWSKLSDTQKVAFAKERGWEGAYMVPTTDLRRDGLWSPQRGLAIYDVIPGISTLSFDTSGIYRFRVCAEDIVIKLVANQPPGACSPELAYTMDTVQ